MKLITGLALAIALSAGSAFAGEGQISQTGLEAFGLGDITPVTDTEGLSVRGQGSWTFVGGGSYSRLPGTRGGNVYGAGSSNQNRRSSAEGGSESFSGFELKTNHNDSRFSIKVNNGSFGGSYAIAR
jgi:hypothetical protein